MRATQRRKRRCRPLTTFSLFCGFGGETLGKQLALKELGIYDQCTFWALNHWQLAVEQLQRNCPHALTFVAFAADLDAAPHGDDEGPARTCRLGDSA